MSDRRVLILENLLTDLLKSRKELGDYFMMQGCDVYYACPNEVEHPGVANINLSRNRLGLLQFVNELYKLRVLEKDNSLNTVLSFRLVPNILNVASSILNPKVQRVLVITGLGVAFMEGNSKSFTRLAIKIFYQLSSHRFRIVVQNIDDAFELKLKAFKLINGSGISGSVTNISPRRNHLRLLFAGRLLKSKGVMESLEVLRLLRLLDVDATLTVAGGFDKENPDSISEDDYSKLREAEGVKLLGHVNNLDEIYRGADVLLFLSTYREGVPRVMIESLRHGLTICTLNMPGCKEGVVENGIMIDSLEDRRQIVDYLAGLNEHKLISNMKNSHRLFESKFSSKVIYNKYFDAIQ